MSDRLKEFAEDILKYAEIKGYSVAEVHQLPLAIQMILEEEHWIKDPYKRRLPQEEPKGNQ